MRKVFLILWALLAGVGAARAQDAVPASVFFPVVPFEATADTTVQYVPLAVSHSFEEAHPGIDRAVIAIHDETRDASAVLNVLLALAGTQGSTTFVAAPQFMLPSDIARFADHLPEKGAAIAQWDAVGWSRGDDSLPVRGRKSLSSFTVVDLLAMYLADRRRFPDLHTVVIVGYGAGGAFVQRYAAFNAAADILSQQNIGMRYVAAGSPSYLYLTASRLLGGRKGFGPADATACPAYNSYPYGLDNLNPYARRHGANAAKMDYVSRFIVYLNAPVSDAVPDLDCAVQMQGQDRAARAVNYRMYLQSLYGELASRTQTFAVPKDARPDAVGLFGSVCGMAMIFGDGLCPPSYGRVE